MFKKVWDVLILIILLYTATYAPFKVAFMPGDSSNILFIFETIVDILFIADIFVMFFTPYERADSSLECRHKKIAKNYFLGAFVIDIVASFPTQYFEFGGGENGGSGNKLARLARLQRLYRLMRIFRVIKIVKIFKYNKLFTFLMDYF